MCKQLYHTVCQDPAHPHSENRTNVHTNISVNEWPPMLTGHVHMSESRLNTPMETTFVTVQSYNGFPPTHVHSYSFI